MLTYGIETYLDSLYPKGGVAPLRHELATYEYLERKRQYHEQAEPRPGCYRKDAGPRGTSRSPPRPALRRVRKRQGNISFL
jgi:hypothetical protein